MPSFRALIETSPDVIYILNPQGKVEYASASSAKVFGYPPEELEGRNLFDLIHPDDGEISRRALREVVAGLTGPRQLEVRVHQKNGQWCWAENTISNLLGDPRVGAIVVNSREISARRAAREQKQQQTDELTRSNAELEHFAYAIAHDLREPLRTISMFTELLVRKAQLTADGKQLTEVIIDGVTRMSALLEGLHAFAVRGFDELPQPVDLGQVMSEVVQNLAHAIAASGAVVTHDRLPSVQGSEKHMSGVCQNLIANAIKYRGDSPAKVHVSAERVGPDWIIKVKDNGIGIPQEHQERVFGLLERLHGPEIPGAGIGLAICKKIIEALGGTIWVVSEPGAGSTFCFTIAAAREDGSDFGGPYLSRGLTTAAEPLLTRAVGQSEGIELISSVQ